VRQDPPRDKAYRTLSILRRSKGMADPDCVLCCSPDQQPPDESKACMAHLLLIFALDGTEMRTVNQARSALWGRLRKNDISLMSWVSKEYERLCEHEVVLRCPRGRWVRTAKGTNLLLYNGPPLPTIKPLPEEDGGLTTAGRVLILWDPDEKPLCVRPPRSVARGDVWAFRLPSCKISAEGPVETHVFVVKKTAVTEAECDGLPFDANGVRRNHTHPAEVVWL
jgi:hypothetical protein